mgnify:CR=1 FL=1
MDEIRVVPYDAGWVKLFEEAATQLEKLFPNAQIEHIGSTSVVGLDAKPIIDIMLGVESLTDGEIIRKLESVGYKHWKEDTFQNERLFFTKWDSEKKNRLVHIHATVIGNDFWKDQIRFRDILRSKPEIAHEYAILKKQLAERLKNDRDGYTEAKTEFVKKILSQ